MNANTENLQDLGSASELTQSGGVINQDAGKLPRFDTLPAV